MPAKPDLDKLLDLVQHINRSERAGFALPTFAEQVLPAVQGCLPTARVVRLYRVDDDSAQVLAATVPGAAQIRLTGDNVYCNALNRDQPQQDPRSGVWVAAICASARRVGLLEIGFPAEVPIPPQVPAWMELITSALAGPFERLHTADALPATEPDAGDDLMQDRLRTLSILNDLALLLSSTMDENLLLHESCRAMVQALAIEHCGVVLLDRSGRFGQVVADYPDKGLQGAIFDMQTNPLYAEIWQNARPIFVEDVRTDPHLDEPGREIMLGGGVESILLLPLVDPQGQLIGSFGLDNYNQTQPFTTEKLGVARTIAAQLVIGLQNIRLLRETQRQAEQLRAINELGQRLQTLIAPAEILDAVLAASAAIMPLDRMYIALHDPQDGSLRTAARYDSGEQYLTLDGGAALSLTDTFAGQVWQTGDMRHIPDTASADTPAHDLPEMRSLLGLPLIAGTQPLGTLCLGHHEPYTYTEADQAVLPQLAGLLATAIDQARRSNLSFRQARNEALINDITAQLQQQTDVRAMLQVTAEQLGQALGARKAHIHLKPPTGDQE